MATLAQKIAKKTGDIAESIGGSVLRASDKV